MKPKSNIFMLYFIIFMHACRCNARAFSNSHGEFPPQKIQEKYVFSGKSSDFSNSSRSKQEDIVHKKDKGIGEDGSGYFGELQNMDAHKCINQRSEDSEYWLHNSTMNTTKLKGGRLQRLNNRGKASNSPILSDKNSMETDYEPPHRKSPIHN